MVQKSTPRLLLGSQVPASCCPLVRKKDNKAVHLLRSPCFRQPRSCRFCHKQNGYGYGTRNHMWRAHDTLFGTRFLNGWTGLWQYDRDPGVLFAQSNLWKVRNLTHACRQKILSKKPSKNRQKKLSKEFVKKFVKTIVK